MPDATIRDKAMPRENAAWKVVACATVVVAIVLGLQVLRQGQPAGEASQAGTVPLEPSANAPLPATDSQSNKKESVSSVSSTPPTIALPTDELLGNQDPRVRQKALELLAVWKPEEAALRVPRILEAEKDAQVLLIALDVAGRQKVADTFEQVKAKLGSEDPAVRRKAVATLGQLADALSESDREKATLAVINTMEQETRDLGRPPEDKDMGIFIPYVGALGQIKTVKSTERLLLALRVPRQNTIRRIAAGALEGRVTVEHGETLKACWCSESDGLVRQAIEALLAKEPFNLTVDRKQMALVPAKR